MITANDPQTTWPHCKECGNEMKPTVNVGLNDYCDTCLKSARRALVNIDKTDVRAWIGEITDEEAEKLVGKCVKWTTKSNIIGSKPFRLGPWITRGTRKEWHDPGCWRVTPIHFIEGEIEFFDEEEKCSPIPLFFWPQRFAAHASDLEDNYGRSLEGKWVRWTDKVKNLESTPFRLGPWYNEFKIWAGEEPITPRDFQQGFIEFFIEFAESPLPPQTAKIIPLTAMKNDGRMYGMAARIWERSTAKSLNDVAAKGREFWLIFGGCGPATIKYMDECLKTHGLQWASDK